MKTKWPTGTVLQPALQKHGTLCPMTFKFMGHLKFLWDITKKLNSVHFPIGSELKHLLQSLLERLFHIHTQIKCEQF